MYKYYDYGTGTTNHGALKLHLNKVEARSTTDDRTVFRLNLRTALGLHSTTLRLFPSVHMDLDKSVLKTEATVPPEVHPFAIFSEVSSSVVLPETDSFPTGKTYRLSSHTPYVSSAFVLVIKNISAHTAAPLPVDIVERGCTLTAGGLWQ